MSRRREDGEINYFGTRENGVSWGLKIKLKDKGPCDECIVKATCKDVCEEAWDFHLGKIARRKRTGKDETSGWAEELAPIWDKRL